MPTTPLIPFSRAYDICERRIQISDRTFTGLDSTDPAAQPIIELGRYRLHPVADDRVDHHTVELPEKSAPAEDYRNIDSAVIFVPR